jgi:hypothetical protein
VATGFGGGGPVIDLRGQPTGMEELGRGLAQLVGALSQDPNDKIRAALMADPEMGRQAAVAYREWAENVKQLPGDALNRLGNANATAPGLPNPGGGLIPIEVMAEMSSLFPATREEDVGRALRGIVTPQEEAAARARPIQVEAARGRAMTPEEEADVQNRQIRTTGSVATLEGRKAERELDVTGALERAGFTPEAEADLRGAQIALSALQTQLDTAGVMIDQQGMEDFAQLYATASPRDRQLLTLGISGPRGAHLAQRLLSDDNYNKQLELTRLQSAKTPEEAALARFEFVTAIRKERDRLIERIEEAPQDQVPGLIEDINSLADDLLRVDPGLVAQIAVGDPGLIGSTPESAKFGIKTYLQTLDGADKLEINAQILARQGLSQSEVTKVRDALKDPSTGVVNEIMFAAIMERANQIRTNAQDENNKVINQSLLALISDQTTRQLLTNGQTSSQLATALDTAIAEGKSPTVIANLLRETQAQRQFEFFLQPPRSDNTTSVVPR